MNNFNQHHQGTGAASNFFGAPPVASQTPNPNNVNANQNNIPPNGATNRWPPAPAAGYAAPPQPQNQHTQPQVNQPPQGYTIPASRNVSNQSTVSSMGSYGVGHPAAVPGTIANPNLQPPVQQPVNTQAHFAQQQYPATNTTNLATSQSSFPPPVAPANVGGMNASAMATNMNTAPPAGAKNFFASSQPTTTSAPPPMASGPSNNNASAATLFGQTNPSPTPASIPAVTAAQFPVNTAVGNSSHTNIPSTINVASTTAANINNNMNGGPTLSMTGMGTAGGGTMPPTSTSMPPGAASTTSATNFFSTPTRSIATPAPTAIAPAQVSLPPPALPAIPMPTAASFNAGISSGANAPVNATTASSSVTVHAGAMGFFTAPPSSTAVSENQSANVISTNTQANFVTAPPAAPASVRSNGGGSCCGGSVASAAELFALNPVNTSTTTTTEINAAIPTTTPATAHVNNVVVNANTNPSAPPVIATTTTATAPSLFQSSAAFTKEKQSEVETCVATEEIPPTKEEDAMFSTVPLSSSSVQQSVIEDTEDKEEIMEEMESPALTTAVNLFSKTATAVFQSASNASKQVSEIQKSAMTLKDTVTQVVAPYDPNNNGNVASSNDGVMMGVTETNASTASSMFGAPPITSTQVAVNADTKSASALFGASPSVEAVQGNPVGAANVPTVLGAAPEVGSSASSNMPASTLFGTAPPNETNVGLLDANPIPKDETKNESASTLFGTSPPIETKKDQSDATPALDSNTATSNLTPTAVTPSFTTIGREIENNSNVDSSNFKPVGDSISDTNAVPAAASSTAGISATKEEATNSVVSMSNRNEPSSTIPISSSRLPRRSPRKPRTPHLLPIPAKKALPLPTSSRNKSFASSFLKHQQELQQQQQGDENSEIVSVSSMASSIRPSGTSVTSGGGSSLFRIPPPIQIHTNRVSRTRSPSPPRSMMATTIKGGNDSILSADINSSPLAQPTQPSPLSVAAGAIDRKEEENNESNQLEKTVNTDQEEKSSAIENEKDELVKTVSENIVEGIVSEAMKVVEAEEKVESIPPTTDVKASLPIPPPPTAVIPPLPSGWMELTAPDSGMKYYYNSDNGETTWERPIHKDATESTSVTNPEQENIHMTAMEAVADPSEGENIVKSELETPSSPPKIVEFHTEQPNVSQYELEPMTEAVPEEVTMTNQEVQQEKEIGESNIDDMVMNSEANLDDFPIEKQDDDVKEEPVSASELPNGWIEGIDPSSGKPYYYNEVDGSTMWDKPEAATMEKPAIESEEVVEHTTIERNKISELETEVVGESSPIEDAQPGPEEAFTPHNVVEDPEKKEATDSGRPNHTDSLDGGDAEHLELPSGWVAMLDPTSGKYYYFNEVDGSTTWDKPEAVSLAEPVPVEDSVPEEETSTVPLEIEGNTENSKNLPEQAQVENPKDVALGSEENLVNNHDGDDAADIIKKDSTSNLPAGWIEMSDPVSGKPYYYNEIDGTTTWDRPQSVTAEEHKTDTKEGLDIFISEGTKSLGLEAEPEISSMDQPKVDRENEKEDETLEIQKATEHDRSVHTTESIVYEKTDLDIKNTTEVQEAQGPNVEMASIDNDRKVDDANEGPSSSSELPAGWVEVIDPTSGKPYYYNEVDGSTSWEKPQTTTEEKSEIESKAADENTEIPIEGESVPVEETESVQETLSVTNNATQEISSEISVNVGTPRSVDVRDEEPANISELPPGWLEMLDPASGKPYYCNETDGTTTWDKPEAPSAALREVDREDEKKESKSENHVDSVSIAEPESVDPIPSPDLPAGWIEVEDPNSGQTYYYNEADGSTSWEKPSLSTAELDDNIQEEVPREPNTMLKVGGKNTEVEESLTNETSEKDELDSTKDTGLTIPRKDSIEDNVNSCSASKSELPDGWVEVKDPASGKPYYHNELDGSTSWEKPSTPTAKAESEKFTDKISITSEKTNTHVSVSDGKSTNKLEDPKRCELPTGWIEVKDPVSGKPYYYNEAEGITSWEKPSTSQSETKSRNSDVKHETEASVNQSFAGEQNSRVSVGDSSLVGGWVQLGRDDGVSVDSSVHIDSMLEKEPKNNEKKTQVLPPEWVELKDPVSGKTYYFNGKTQVTTWDFPTPSPPDGLQQNKSAVERDSSSTNGGNFRHRPAHAIASFGFGGRLCVMMPRVAENLSMPSVSECNKKQETNNWRKGPVAIHRVSSLMSTDQLPFSNERGDAVEVGSVSPLSTLSDDEVLSQLNKKSGEGRSDNELLWSLIFVAARWKGRLRSSDGVSDPNGPESAIVDLLLRHAIDNNGSLQPLPTNTDSTQDISTMASLEEVQELLLHGKREEAVTSALSSKNYALALLLASVCDYSTYQDVALRFTDEALVNGTPLHTVATLLANQINDNGNDTPDWRRCSGNLHNTWRHHLAIILSNQTRGWKKIVVSLGDQLMYLGHTHAAHFCYMISGCPIASVSDPSARLCLVGCNHDMDANLTLMNSESIESFQRTEAWEWAKRKGNPHVTIAVFQSFKLKFASSLADYGLEKSAKLYVDSLRKCTGLESVDIRESTETSSVYPKVFVQELDVFEDRLCASMGLDPPVEKKQKKPSKISLPGVLSNLVGGSGQASAAKKVDMVDESFASANSNILDVTNATFSSAVDTMPTMPKSKPVSTISEQRTVEKEEVKTEAPVEKTTPVPMFHPAAVPSEPNIEKDMPKVSEPKQPTPIPAPNSVPSSTPIKTQGKPQVSPATAPTPTTKNKKGEAPPSSGTKKLGILGRLVKKLNPNATIADTGDEMQAYFDKKLGVWVFPGENPEDLVEKKLAPPPTMSSMETTPVAAPKPVENDPLSNLMAPPPSRGITPARGMPPSATGGRYNANTPPIGRGIPNRPPYSASPMASKAPASESMPVTPQFVIFKPDDTKKDSSEAKTDNE